MSKWEVVRLGDVCEIISGTTPSTNKPELWDGNIKWITPAEISIGSYFIYDTERHISERAGLKSMPAGTVLLSSRAPIGKVAIAGEPMCCNQGFKNLICSDNIHNRYLYRYLKNQTEYLNSLGRGATFKEISKSIVEDIKIPLPPLPIQQKIAGIFDCASALIEKRKVQIEKLDLLVKSQFIKMFADPVTNPMGWETVELGKLTDVGSSKRIFANEYVDSGIPFYRTKEVVELSRGKEIGTPLYISQERYEVISNEFGHPEKGDLLISAVGTIGIIWAVDNDDPFYFKDGNLILVKKSEMVDSIVLRSILERLIKSSINDISAGSAYSALTIVKLKQMRFPLPPLHIQTQFTAFVERVEAQKTQIKQGLELLELEYTSLMQKCFEGEMF